MRAVLTLEQVKAPRPAAAYGPADGFIKPDQFVEAVYTSLRHPPASAPHEHGANPHSH